MGEKHIDGILLNKMLRGVDSHAVVGPVAPFFYDRTLRGYRAEYVREFWPVVQLWDTAKLADDQSGLAARRLYDLLRTPS
jgi:hypothetical protein